MSFVGIIHNINIFINALAQGDKINYEEHVRPIFADRCLSCHNPDQAKGGLDLSTYSATMQGGSSGEIVNSGDPNGSRLYLSVLIGGTYNASRGEKVAKDKLDLISSWISAGLLENSGSKAKKPKPTFNLALKQHPQEPDGPPPMPEHLTLEPVATSSERWRSRHRLQAMGSCHCRSCAQAGPSL